jgi:uncharacterized membrane protein YjfL (UPF0719 family)
MTLDQVLTALIYLVSVFVVFFVGKFAFDRFNRGYDLNHELLHNDNFALALNVVGYYAGLIFALGGVLYGDNAMHWLDDVIDITLYGVLAILLLNISGLINDKLILGQFDNKKEIIDDRNAGTGVVEGANYLASGLMVGGALSGEGDIVTGLAFWSIGQLVLIIAAKLYNAITPYNLHDEIEKDNVAVGVAFAGVLIAFGMIVRTGIHGDFVSWSINLSELAGFVVFGLLLLPLLRLITDKLLLPGVKLTDELVNQDEPNVGAGTIEAFSYIAASLLISWIV